MENFTFVNTTKIVFGRGAEEGVGREVKPFSSRSVTLQGLGVRDDRLQEMARKCTERGPVGNVVKLGRDEVLEVHKLAV